MDYNEMIVTLKNGSSIYFFRDGKVIKVILDINNHIYINEIDSNRLRASVGKRLSFLYYGNNNKDTCKKKMFWSPIKKITYKFSSPVKEFTLS